MKRLLTWIEYKFDYVMGYIMTNPMDLPRYHRYMYTKWGERYCTKEEYDEYLESLNQEL